MHSSEFETNYAAATQRAQSTALAVAATVEALLRNRRSLNEYEPYLRELTDEFAEACDALHALFK